MQQKKHLVNFGTALLLLPLMAASLQVHADDKDKGTSRSAAVTVNNTNSNPVPVNGNVVVSGNVPVTVTNAVTISNPAISVTVNPGNQPIPVTLSGGEAFEPVTGYCLSFPAGTNASEAKCALFAVPTGKRLVVEALTYNLTGNDADMLLFGPDNRAGSPLEQRYGSNVFPVIPTGKVNPVINSVWVYAGHVTTRFYLDEGQTLVGYGVSYSKSTGSSPMQFGFSGYLVVK